MLTIQLEEMSPIFAKLIAKKTDFSASESERTPPDIIHVTWTAVERDRAGSPLSQNKVQLSYGVIIWAVR